MRLMTYSGLPTLARTAAGRLRALVGRAGDPCCCSGAGAYKARECCDGEPTIWVDSAAVERCGGVGATIRVVSRGPGLDVEGISGRCFTVLPDFLTAAEIARLGVTVWGGDVGGAIGCVSGCFDDRCPVCPDACCIYATLPACEPGALPSSLRCCVLGSAYELDYTESFSEVVERPAGETEGVIDSNCPGVTCRWDHEIVTDRRYRETHGVMVHVARDAEGALCAGFVPSARRTNTIRERVHFVERQEAVDCSHLRSIGGRFIESESITADDVPMFGLGEMPRFREVFDDAGEPASMCGGHYERTWCVIGYPEPCPNPDNPNQAINRRLMVDVRGAVDCDGGEQLVREEEWFYPCGREDLDPERAPVVHTVREWRRVWRVRILSREGCERLTCPEGRRPGPGLVRGVAVEGGGSTAGGGARPCRGCGKG